MRKKEITDKQYILSIILVTIAAILIVIMAVIIATDNQTIRINIDRYSNAEVIMRC